jgi:hypothetical protein
VRLELSVTFSSLKKQPIAPAATSGPAFNELVGLKAVVVLLAEPLQARNLARRK